MGSVTSASVIFVTDERIWGLCEDALAGEGIDAARVGGGGALLARGGEGDEAGVSVAVVESGRVAEEATGLADFVREARERTGAEVIVLGGRASAQDMLAVLNAGACDYRSTASVHKDPEELCHLISRICAERQRPAEDAAAILKSDAGRFIGRSPKLLDAALHASRALAEDTVLLQGETGSGKSFLARTVIEAISPARAANFVRVDCGALADSLMEAELFGWRGQSFTGAGTEDREGLFEQADNGVLFLDEIGNLAPAHQKSLLLALEGDEKDPFKRRVQKIGGKQVVVNVQVLAATQYDLLELIRLGRFIEPLYFRIARCCVHVPPLRERREDIAYLAERLLWAASKRMGKRFVRISKEAIEALKGYPWPGNVRELTSVISAAVRLNRGTTLELDQLPAHVAQTGPELARPVVYGRELMRLKRGLSDDELDRLARVFFAGQVQLLDGTSADYCEVGSAATGNVTRLARDLGISRTTLTKRLKGTRIEDR